MCGCASTGSSVSSPRQIAMREAALSNTEYSLDMLITWRNKLLCVKEQDLYSEVSITSTDLNKNLGIVMSAISNPVNISYLSYELSQVQDIILRIINTGKCQ